MIGRIEAEVGPVDVLVNNAGLETVGAFADSPAEDLRRIAEANYLAPAELCRQVIPRMLDRGGGHIVNVSSLAANVNIPGTLAYSASKAALSHFTSELRSDLRGLPITMTLVELGPVPTAMLAVNDTYGPTAAAFRRCYRLGLAVDVPRETVAQNIVTAVEKGKNHVRLPKRAAAFAMVSEPPRRLNALLLTGVPHQD